MQYKLLEVVLYQLRLHQKSARNEMESGAENHKLKVLIASHSC